MIAQLESQYPVTLLCELLQVSRSSYYYEPVEPDESTVREALEKLAAEFPTYARGGWPRSYGARLIASSSIASASNA